MITLPVKLFAAASVALSVSGGFVIDRTIDGPYRLVAVDVPEDASVCLTLDGGDCLGRVDGSVFAVGWNETHVVVARHPMGLGGQADRSKTEYYYIIRSLDGVLADPSVSVKGPFDKVAFENEKARVKLPGFTMGEPELR